MRRMIDFYNFELSRFNSIYFEADKKERDSQIESFINTDPSLISWNRGLKNELGKSKAHVFYEDHVVPSMYRPYTKQWLYFDKSFNDMIYQVPKMFPVSDLPVENRVMSFPSKGEEKGFSVVMTDITPDLHLVHGGQCFPRYLYIPTRPRDGELLLDTGASANAGLVRQDAITDEGLAHFQAAYVGEAITKDDLFYYTYGLLHSPDYRDRYADNLSKELPRIPAVKSIESFRAFVEAGRKLGDLHVGYESVEPYPVVIAQGDLRLAHIDNAEAFYRVEQMKFAGKRPKLDKTTVIYNANITMTGIPLDAYEYVVNGKPALEWVMERQSVKTDKASGIVNDANRYAIETVGDPAYPLLLFQRVITVSLETMKIVHSLPPLGDLA